ncbi:ABC transporter ATP-binding protein/permease [Lachnospiraceae bacterium OttesenSCG-928-D06]|nr:ABC transporter ATP-binding protein/permease [Lachnospiraceae bacterium OttesenSCG-928-D06]
MKSIKYKELVNIFQNRRRDQIKLFILSAISIAFDLYFVYNIQGFIDSIIDKVDSESIIYIFLKICIIGILTFVTGTYQTSMWHQFRYKIINQMRTMMYDSVIKKRASFFDKRTTGDIVSAVMNDGSIIAENVGISILMLFLNIFQVVIIISTLVYKNIILGTIVIILGLIYFALINRINKKMRENYKDFSQENANLNQRLTEDVKTIYEIKTLNEKEFFSKQFFSQVWDKYFVKVKKVIRIEVLSNAINSIASIIVPVFLILLGGFFLYKNMLTVGVLLLFYTYSQKLLDPLNNLADFYRGSQIAMGAAERIHEYLFSTEDREEITTSSSDDNLDLTIDIHRFTWGEQDILQNIHVRYQRGDRIFLHGESGAGKTTLLKLICGFYKVTDGVIKICNKDVYQLSEEDLFEIVKIQFQEPVVIEGSLRDNINLGKSYTDDEMKDILSIVNLGDFIEANGLDYYISEYGRNLSGGQKQRLALARTLIRKPKLLILDEATNGLDFETEKDIVQKLEHYVVKNGMILLVTSHKNAIREICNKTLEL